MLPFLPTALNCVPLAAKSAACDLSAVKYNAALSATTVALTSPKLLPSACASSLKHNSLVLTNPVRLPDTIFVHSPTISSADAMLFSPI